MVEIVEFAPTFIDSPPPTGVHHVGGVWNSTQQTARLAAGRGHRYRRPEPGPVPDERAEELIAGADALVVAPTAVTVTGMWQPQDGERAGRLIGAAVLDRVAAQRPDLHIVLVTHFLVGHGSAHRNSRSSTWSLAGLEAHLRAGANPWTILRPTWLSTIHDPDYRVRLAQDPLADGLISTEGVADAVVTAVENPGAAAGRTAALYTVNNSGAGERPLVDQFADLDRDFEALVGAVGVGVDR